MELGARIAELRTAAGLNQSELARKLEVTPQAVQAWEKGGGIRPSKFEALAAALNVSVAMLLLGEEVGAPSQSRRITADTLQDAMGFLDELDKVFGRPVSLRPNPQRLAVAIETVSEGAMVDGKSVVVRLADRLRERGVERGDESGGTARTGAADGGTHGHRARKAAAPRGGH